MVVCAKASGAGAAMSTATVAATMKNFGIGLIRLPQLLNEVRRPRVRTFQDGRFSFAAYLIFSKSPGIQVRSKKACSGPNSRIIANQPFPGTVLTQFPSTPSGASGPK